MFLFVLCLDVKTGSFIKDPDGSEQRLIVGFICSEAINATYKDQGLIQIVYLRIP